MAELAADSPPQKTFTLSLKAKASIKTALAFIIVYWIALSSSWLNPSWAAFAVAMIDLPTAGQSIRKGIFRCLGTIPGCLAAFCILAIAPQEPWLFIFISCLWVGSMTYMMLVDSEHSYFWNIAGFVCLIILISPPTGIDSYFQHAVMRTVETLMGVIVYTLVFIFLWPQKNSGAIKKTFSELMGTQKLMQESLSALLCGKKINISLEELNNKQVSQFNAFVGARQAETVENVNLYDNRLLLKDLQTQVELLHSTLRRWRLSLHNHEHINILKIFPSLENYLLQQTNSMAYIGQLVEGDTNSKADIPEILLTPDNKELSLISSYDLAAVSLTIKEIKAADEHLRHIIQILYDIYALNVTDNVRKEAVSEKNSWLVPDLDVIQGVVFIILITFSGFMIWIYFDPPGHMAYLQLPTAVGMFLVSLPQFRSIQIIKCFAISLPLALCIYVFILPELTLFSELATVLFLCVFIVCYYFDGVSKLLGVIAIINMISIQNTQTYDFAAMINSMLFMFFTTTLVFIFSYFLRSSRPEKALLALMKRFFTAASWIIYDETLQCRENASWSFRLKYWFYSYELRTLPAKMMTWGRSIDTALYHENSLENTTALLTQLQALSYRLQQLQDVRKSVDIDVGNLNLPMVAWQKELKKMFMSWFKGHNISSFDRHTALFEKDIETILHQQSISQTQMISLLNILGCYRGITETNHTYMEMVNTMNIQQWQQERFS